MKKIIALIITMLAPSMVMAQVITSAQLMGLGMPAQLAGKVAAMSNAASGDTVDIGVNGTVEFQFGNDGIVFTGTDASLAPDSADNSDNRSYTITGGGAATTTRGGYITVTGNEHASDGAVIVSAGGDAGGHVDLAIENASAMVRVRDTTSGTIWQFEDDGDIQGSATLGGDIIISRTGKTIAIDSGTAASACTGSATTNGTTAVTVSTTCAATGAHIFLSRTADATGTAANDQSGCWATNIVNGTSFDIDCSDTGDNGAMNWLIVKEG